MVTTQAPWRQAWKDYYEILGVSREAGSDEIKRTYREQSFILHPDRLQGAPEGARRRAEAEFKRVNEAYEVLGDPELREEYNRDYKLRSEKSGGNIAYSRSLSVRPREVSVSITGPGEPARIRFTLDAVGFEGSGSSLRLQPDQPWVAVLEVSADSLDAGRTFPLKVMVELETLGLEFGKTYEAGLYVFVEDAVARVGVTLRVEEAASAAGVSSAPGDLDQNGATAVTTAGFPWLFEWLSWPWRIWLVALSGLAAPALACLWAISDMGEPGTFSGAEEAAIIGDAVVFALAAGLAIYASGWLKTVGASPWYVRLACTLFVFSGMLIVVALATAAVVFILFVIVAVIVTFLAICMVFAMLGALLDS